MITITTTLDGFQIGDALAGDAEATSKCLAELASQADSDFIVEAGFYAFKDIPKVCAFLRQLADEIDLAESLTLPIGTHDRRWSVHAHSGEVFQEGEDFDGTVLHIEVKSQAEADALIAAMRELFT